MLKVYVKDCNLENVVNALKILKKKLQKEGVFRELKLCKFAESKAQKDLRKYQEAVKRLHKLRKQVAQNRRNNNS